ncbi:DNA polymerase III subunit [Rhodohalobacter halophilus]|uniref:DNA polymerase III subunit n=1 Tax=Rhodohalobacter halophilus TaxID=1812810 RepID=UPI00083F6051|nr:AAA family ATPase [Rhodohalobacter halophilus]
MSFIEDHISFGDRRIVGQSDARHKAEKILKSNRLSHAYLITGPSGVGKTAFALAMAEAINGIDNLTDLKGTGVSKKSSWFAHPDIHLFIPFPSKGENEIQPRIEMLAQDPYEIVDFAVRPALNSDKVSKNRRAFYPIDYYRSDIQPLMKYNPNEGRRTVVVITEIDTMRKEAANAFLKFLEEPSSRLVFVLTATKTDQLLPTIISRCQQIRLNPLEEDEIRDALVRYDHKSETDASFLARMADGNYSLSRFFDVETLKRTREEIIDFLRYSYTQDVPALLTLINEWNKKLNTENQIAVCNSLEQLLRDILVYRERQDSELVTNVDQIDVIKKFTASMQNARIIDMIEHLQNLKQLLYQNVQLKYIFSVLSMRFSSLMRGVEPVIPEDESWKHLPAFSEM